MFSKMYTIVKFYVFDDVLQRITVGLWESFHSSNISSESYRYPPLQKPKKCDKGGGVSVAKPWDVSYVHNSFSNAKNRVEDTFYRA